MKERVIIAFICTLFCLNFVFLLSFICAEIIISEVEIDPFDSCSDCTEWIEFYSSEQIEITNAILKNYDDNEKVINLSFQGYYAFYLGSRWFDNNQDEQVLLYNLNQTLITSTPILKENANNGETWQYCSGEWLFRQGTPSVENNCTVISQNNQTTNTDNKNNTNTDTQEEIRIELDWQDEDIIAGEEFEIEVSVFNLENYEYDLKIWIEEDGQTISERYDKDTDEWKSGYYYLEDLFEGTGDKKKNVLMRLNKDNKDFKGDTKIYVKLRKGSSNVLEYDKKIEIIEQENTSQEDSTNINFQEDSTNINFQETNTTSPITGEIIKLSPESSKSTMQSEKIENSIIYKSKNEYIKEYIGYAFAFICVILIIILLIKGV